MANAKFPKVSIGMPVYNGADYIAESIASVLAQTYRVFELIVCDNCSTDNTKEIVRGFSDPRIRYIRNPKNLGLVGNANRCLELATGEYIGILHHDDVMMPDNLERKVRLLDEHPNVGFVHSNIILIDSKGEVVSWNIWSEDSRRDYIESGMKVFQRFLAYFPLGASIFIGAVLARRECYERLGGFSSELPHCNDGEMWMRMSLFYNVACIGTPLVKYRVHPMSTSSNFGDWTSAPYLREHYLAVKMIFEKYREQVPDSKNLARKVSFAFAEQALRLANIHIGRGEFPIGKILFNEAKRLNPNIFKREAFWITAAKLMAGPKGVSLYKKLRNAVKMALRRIIEEKRLGVLRYQCNICGEICKWEVVKLNREEKSCRVCGSTVRFRAVIHSLSKELFGKSIPIPDFPKRADLAGIGMTDWDGYAIPLSQKLSYRNTYYHKPPRLDITSLEPSSRETYNFIISSDVLEHVVPPVLAAFKNVYGLLKPGGVFILTVPYVKEGITREHFPDLYNYEIIKKNPNCHILKNITRENNEQTFYNIKFHAGDGVTLEMRYFSEPSLMEELERAGFKEIKIYSEPYFLYGIYHSQYSQNDSFPITARKPS